MFRLRWEKPSAIAKSAIVWARALRVAWFLGFWSIMHRSKQTQTLKKMAIQEPEDINELLEFMDNTEEDIDAVSVSLCSVMLLLVFFLWQSVIVYSFTCV
jgi:hypothetical protein